jgi:hypothetical protein
MHTREVWRSWQFKPLFSSLVIYKYDGASTTGKVPAKRPISAQAKTHNAGGRGAAGVADAAADEFDLRALVHAPVQGVERAMSGA